MFEGKSLYLDSIRVVEIEASCTMSAVYDNIRVVYNHF